MIAMDTQNFRAQSSKQIAFWLEQEMQQNCDEGTKGRLVDELFAHGESMTSFNLLESVHLFSSP